MRNTLRALLLVGCMAPTALAQYSTTFESVNASDTGVVLTGQDGFYIPPDTDSVTPMSTTYLACPSILIAAVSNSLQAPDPRVIPHSFSLGLSAI